jgi:hypothetical protein
MSGKLPDIAKCSSFSSKKISGLMNQSFYYDLNLTSEPSSAGHLMGAGLQRSSSYSNLREIKSMENRPQSIISTEPTEKATSINFRALAAFNMKYASSVPKNLVLMDSVSSQRSPRSRRDINSELIFNIQVCPRVFLTNDICERLHHSFVQLSIEQVACDQQCDDLIPANLVKVMKFVNKLHDLLAGNSPDIPVVVCAADNLNIAHAALMIGAYMIIKLGSEIDEVTTRFKPIDMHLAPNMLKNTASPIERNVQNGEGGLRVPHYWAALRRAASLSWTLDFDADEHNSVSTNFHDGPAPAYLHELVPGKLVAMQGPLCGSSCRPETNSSPRNGPTSSRQQRVLSPDHCARLYSRFRVQAVVSVSAHDPAESAARGLAFADLPFDDAASPPADVTAKFLRIADAVPGALAVLARAGPARAGTLAGLYLMRGHGFAAAEAAAWLRLAAPGSMGAAQLRYLADREGVMRAPGVATGGWGGRGWVEDGVPYEEVAARVAGAVAEVDGRMASVRRRRSSAYPVAPGPGNGGARALVGSLAVASAAPPSGPGAAAAVASQVRPSTAAREPGPAAHGGGGSAPGSAGAGGYNAHAGGCAERCEPAPIRFCADLLPLPTA